MKYRIQDMCIACGACEANCPVGAISFDNDKQIYQIDQEKCIECGTCAAICPMGAPTAEE